jgi:uncharacterized beta-barrel protein YwiB (DUF1934 family)
MSEEGKKRPCHIYFQTRQEAADGFGGTSEEIFLEYEGNIYETENGFFIRYNDSGGKASIRINNNIITITNAGNSGNRMVFDEKRDFELNYAAGGRVMNMRIVTEKAHTECLSGKMIIDLKYRILVNEELLSLYTPRIEVTF